MANTEIKLIIISIFYKIQYMQVLQLLSNMLRPLLDAVDNSFSQFEPLTKLAQLLRVRPAHIALSIFILGVISLGTGFFSKVFVALFGMIYPAYMTFKALGKNDHEQNKYWLTYWIVFGLFTAFSGIIKSAFFFFLSYRSYNVFRIMFYLFLFHPSTQGAKWIYEGVLKRRLNQLSSQTPNTD